MSDDTDGLPTGGYLLRVVPDLDSRSDNLVGRSGEESHGSKRGLDVILSPLEGLASVGGLEQGDLVCARPRRVRLMFSEATTKDEASQPDGRTNVLLNNVGILEEESSPLRRGAVEAVLCLECLARGPDSNVDIFLRGSRNGGD